MCMNEKNSNLSGKNTEQVEKKGEEIDEKERIKMTGKKWTSMCFER